MQTSLGQAMDLLSAPNSNEKPNIDDFTMKKYSAIVKYKTAYYSFFLPVALAMHMVSLKEINTLLINDQWMINIIDSRLAITTNKL